MDANSTYILKIATTKTINAFVSYSSVMTLRLCRDMTNQDGGIREELWNRSNRLLTDETQKAFNWMEMEWKESG